MGEEGGGRRKGVGKKGWRGIGRREGRKEVRREEGRREAGEKEGGSLFNIKKNNHSWFQQSTNQMEASVRPSVTVRDNMAWVGLAGRQLRLYCY